MEQTPTPETEQPEAIFVCKGRNTVINKYRLPEPPPGYYKAYLVSGGERGKGYYYLRCKDRA